jgi:hypothetical protein
MVSASGEICAIRRIEKRVIVSKKMVVFILIRPVIRKVNWGESKHGPPKTGLRKIRTGKTAGYSMSARIEECKADVKARQRAVGFSDFR